LTGNARTIIVVSVAGIVIALGTLGIFLAVRGKWRRDAERMGCFGCHGPGGAQPIGNPGAKGGEVPGWTGGTWMMWNRDERDVRAWILKGRPEHRAPDVGALIKMPAYESRLTTHETDDLVAYVLAASHFGTIEDPTAAAGHEVAYRNGCFGCHGAEGRGLIMNPGSFKGYIPPWDGADYAELVRDDAELSQWVRNGASDRLLANPIAKKLLQTQAIAMPAYGDRITDVELRELSAYVAWVRSHPRGSP